MDEPGEAKPVIHEFRVTVVEEARHGVLATIGKFISDICGFLVQVLRGVIATFLGFYYIVIIVLRFLGWYFLIFEEYMFDASFKVFILIYERFV